MTSESDATLPVSASTHGAELAVTVVPRSSRTGIEQLPDGTIRIRLATPPVAGAANTALLRFLAEALDIPRSRLSITSGAASRRKRIAIAGIAVEQLDAKLRAAMARRL